MKIVVDADACPVKKEIVNVAQELKLPVVMFFDNSHIYQDGYSQVIIVDQGRDAVDFALINKIEKNDIAITQDYGVAAMVLAKGAYAINNNGIKYTQDNIDELLFNRHLSAKIRRAGGKTKGPKKRDKESNLLFEDNLKRLCLSIE